MLKRTLILAAFLTLVVGAGAGCDWSHRTDFRLLNNCQYEIYPDGGAELNPTKARVLRVQHASIREVEIHRPAGTHVATLVITSFYELEDPRKKGVTIVLTEYPVGTFAAVSSDPKLHIRVDNF